MVYFSENSDSDYRNLPIVVDLDGTLTLSDTLAESLIQLVRANPVNAFRLPFWLTMGRAACKNAVASHAALAVEHLPYRKPLIAYLAQEKERGRKILLATAAHKTIAERVATHLGLFDEVLATDCDTNLKGEAKLQKVRASVGDRFVYAGDSRADLPIWSVCQRAVLAGVSHRLAGVVRKKAVVEREFRSDSARFTVWLKALRVHQWLKNLLLFVPMLTAFSFSGGHGMVVLAMAFVSMSLGASATYIGNDLWDIENDRLHPRKRNRPFASGALSIRSGVACGAGLLTVSLAMALAVSAGFASMLLLYLILTTVYSLLLKTRVVIDVLTLSLLYTLRIVAGAVAIHISVSHWLLAFSIFTFLSLALVKRCAELVLLRESGQMATAGRDYRVQDLEILWSLGTSAALAAVVVFGLFISSAETASRYAMPELLWFVAVGLIYLFTQLWVMTGRGQMHDDPLIYLIEDRSCRLAILVMLIIMMVAHFLPYKIELLL
jgi:4-hydroxybenzoate polyprenyltransferase/phosphoserine phosphatase